MFGACAGNSLGAVNGSIGSPGTEAPSPFFRWLERVIEDRP